MKYGAVPGVDKPVSRIVQGTTMCTTDRQEESEAVLDAAFSVGINTFDTANVYGGGKNERSVGQWIQKRGVREKVVILAKGAHHSADRKRVTPFDITHDLHDALARFKVEYVDLFILHRDDPDVPVGPIVEQLHRHKEEGLIGAYGGSNWSHRRIAEANEYAEKHRLTPFLASSPNYSLADQLAEPWEGCLSISGAQGAEAREWYRRTGLALFTWSSMAGGFLSGRWTRENIKDAPALVQRCYASEDNFRRLDRARELAQERGVSVPQIALAYILNQPLNIFALVASANLQEAQANAAALDIRLSEAERAWLDLRSETR